jgi:peptide/nickel transport system substrate-binding protein
MRNLRWQILIALGGLILVVGLMLGQGTTRPDDSPVPVEGGAYSEALVGRIIRLDPILDIFNSVDRDIDRLLFSGLVRFDDKGVAQPDLAESWAISADATLYTLSLRQDAEWHDGTPVTSDDVIYTFSQFQNPDYPGPADLHEFWKQVEINRLDSRNVQFRLPEPFAPFLDYLAVGLLPDHLLRGVTVSALTDHPYHLEPIGTGPFRFEQFLVEDGEITGVSLTAFKRTATENPFLQRIEIRTYPDQTTALQSYKQGFVQGLGEVGPEILSEVLALPELNVYTARLPVVTTVFLNLRDTERPYLSDKSFRRALMLTLNRQWIVDRALGGQALPAIGPIFPGTWAYAEGLEPIPYDPSEAQGLLDALGWQLPVGAAPGSPEFIRTKEGQALGFELKFPDDAVFTKVAEILRDSWAGLGIPVELVPVPPSEIIADVLETRDFQAVLVPLLFTRSPDPDPYPFWHDTQVDRGQNYSGFSDRNTSIWLEQARVTPDTERRAELYRNFQYRFQDQVPALLLYHTVYNYAVSGQVQGISIGPLFDSSDRWSGITDWYLIARRGSGGAVP